MQVRRSKNSKLMTSCLALSLIASHLVVGTAFAQTPAGEPEAAASPAPVDASPVMNEAAKVVDDQNKDVIGNTPPPIDQNKPADAPEKQEYELERVDAKRMRSISLFIGIEQLEQLPYIPGDAKFKGTFKKVTKISLDRNSGMLKFTPQKPGFGTLAIHDAKDKKLYEFRISVQRSDYAKVAQEVRALLSDIEGITIKIINNKVVVDGQVLLPKEMNRIISVVNQYGESRVSSLVTLSPLAQRKIAQAIANDINNPEITVRAVNDKFILEGSAADMAEKDRAEAIAQMYVPDLVKEAGEKDGTIVKLRKTFVLNLIQIKPAPPRDPGKIIQLVVHFVELEKDFEKSFKFQFTPTLADNSSVTFTNDNRSPGGVVSQITGVVSNLLPKLNYAKSHGKARIINSSTLLVLNGQKGTLNNTTQIPYQTAGKDGQPLTSFADAGLQSSITPNILNPRSDSIQLQMDFSVGSLVGQTERGPMISKSQMQTVVIVRSGQSAAVGGLITNTSSTGYNKLPRNNATDPLITLYASKSFQRSQSQFVVFITPIIKASASQGAERIKEKFRLRD